MLDDQVLNTFDPDKEDQILYQPFCCGDPMDGLIPNTMDDSGEKALAVYAYRDLHGLWKTSLDRAQDLPADIFNEITFPYRLFYATMSVFGVTGRSV